MEAWRTYYGPLYHWISHLLRHNVSFFLLRSRCDSVPPQWTARFIFNSRNAYNFHETEILIGCAVLMVMKFHYAKWTLPAHIESSLYRKADHTRFNLWIKNNSSREEKIQKMSEDRSERTKMLLEVSSFFINALNCMRQNGQKNGLYNFGCLVNQEPWYAWNSEKNIKLI